MGLNAFASIYHCDRLENSKNGLCKYRGYGVLVQERTPTNSPLDRLSRMRWGSTMHGNVWEWVEDSWRENHDVAPTDDVTFGLPRRNPTFRITMCTIMNSWRGIRA
jgi:formylglycine-generating enzyme required for sulfatase activity